MTWNNLKEIMFLTLLACCMMFFHVLWHMVLLKYLVTVKASLENCGKKTVLKVNWTGRLFIQRKAFVLYCGSHQYKQKLSGIKVPLPLPQKVGKANTSSLTSSVICAQNNHFIDEKVCIFKSVYSVSLAVNETEVSVGSVWSRKKE